jgi:hypothetical protein
MAEHGPLRPWLYRELRRLADELALPGVARFAVTLIERAQWDDATRVRHDRVQGEVVARLARAFATAAARDEVGPLADPAEVAARLTGPLHFRALVQGRPMTTALRARPAPPLRRPQRRPRRPCRARRWP